MKGDGCSRSKILAHAPGYRVEQSSCGLFHVSIGPVTVHMEPAAFLAFGDVIARATEMTAESQNQSRSMLSLVQGLGSDVAES